MTQILFVHGGGDNAFRFDLELVRRLQKELDTELQYPRVAGLAQIEWLPTFTELSELFTTLRRYATIVAHSAGGAATLKLLSDSGSLPIRNLFLLAPPYKAQDSHWGIDDFTFSNEFGERLDPNLNFATYHSRDDDIIPVGDALLYQQKMPAAQLHLLDGYGHQFSRSRS